MRWQNPWAWLGLLTLVLPVVVHLFSRRQTRVVPFPSLRFIEVSRLLPTRRTQLSDLPLLLLRLLILTAATAALVQPLWSRRANSTSGSSRAVSRALVVDTAVVLDSAERAARESEITRRSEGAAALLSVRTAQPAQSLDGAAAWLALHEGARELVVLSDFRANALDSSDIAALPRDVRVTLVPLRTGVTRAFEANDRSSVKGGVYWATSAAGAVDADQRDAVRTAVLTAVRARGARALRDERVSPASAATASPRILVASPDADSARVWSSAAHELSAPWMGRALLAVAMDSTLIVAGAAVMVTDTMVASPFVTVVRDAQQRPLVFAAALGDSATPAYARLLLISRAPATSLATAALLLASSHALAAPLMTPEIATDSGSTDSSQSALPDSATLARWAGAPAAAALPTGAARPSDALTGQSDARWLWILVLLLLGIEAWLRRRIETEAVRGAERSAPFTSAEASRTTTGDGVARV